MKFTFIDSEFISDYTYIINLEHQEEIRFNPGQFFSISIPDLGINREYSCYCAPNKKKISFLIRKVNGGIISNKLCDLKEGQKVDIVGPYGKFYLEDRIINSKKIFFICSGTGYAPFRSIIKSYDNINFCVIHGVRKETELYALKDVNERSYIKCVSENSNYEHSRVTDYLTANKFEDDSFFMLCGNQNMITDSIKILLKEKNIKSDDIMVETFF